MHTQHRAIKRPSRHSTQPEVAEGQASAGLGIAAFVTSLFAGLCMLVCLVVAGAIDASNLGAEEASLATEWLGLTLATLMFTQLVAAALGIAALSRPGPSRLFAGLGTAIAIAALLGSLLLMAVADVFSDVSVY